MTFKSKIKRSVYKPKALEPYKLSRSKIELWLKCPRCFYLDRRLGISQPAGFPFNLNSAVDHLLKKEFDIHRANGQPHPLMMTYGIEAIPFAHEQMETWRNNFVGVRHLHKPTNFLIFGAVDDIWQMANGQLAVVDYKATSKAGEVNLDADWQRSYKNQMEIYQWLLRQNGFKVANTGYFVYLNGRRDVEAFDGKLEFDVKIIPYEGNDRWIEKTLNEIKNCLDNDNLPKSSPDCEYCAYRYKAAQIEKNY
jgi:CRISPR/Cas system-associated exonuclease Cas4 (RecB family)